MRDTRQIIENFNDNYRIETIIEVTTGTIIKGKSMRCPIHGGDNKHGASIDVAKNIFTCWTSDCGRGLTPWNFIKKYYNLDGFKEVATKCNDLFNANIPIYDKNKFNGIVDVLESTNIIKVNQYLSECNNQIKTLLNKENKILLNATTGLGKTYGITELMNDFVCDYTFFLVPNRTIVEQVEKDYKYNKFYGDDTELPNNKNIVATYHKVLSIIRFIYKENEYRALLGQKPITYNVVCDEVHELMSKRNLYKEFIRELESFIINSDKSILMSANTKDIESAYKDTGLFKETLTVERTIKQFNSNNTFIYRISNKPKERAYIIIDKIIEMLGSHTRVLVYEDNINNLDQYKQLLENEQIPTVIINSKNKDEEEIQQEYNNIIENSKLSKLVVFVTSIINAGVNIKNENVCSIAIQPQGQFDSTKILQFFGRIRNDIENTCILFLDTKEPKKFISSFNGKLRYYKIFTENEVQALNNYYFDKYGLEPIESNIRTDWKLYSKNERYRKIKDCIYIENCIFKIDYVAIYELARKETEKTNYWNNDYIKSLLNDLKTKNIHFATIENSKTLETKAIQEDNELIFENSLQDVFNNNDALKELYLYCKGEIRSKNIEQKETKEFYENFRNSKKYKEFMSAIKTLTKVLNDLNNSLAPLECFYMLLECYKEDTKKKDRDNLIKSIEREYIYNKQFPLGTSYEDIEICGDVIYSITRKTCDCFIGSRNKISNRAYESMLNEYIKFKYKDSYYSNREWYTKEDKKIKTNSIKSLFDECIEHTYIVTEKLFINNLK